MTALVPVAPTGAAVPAPAPTLEVVVQSGGAAGGFPGWWLLVSGLLAVTATYLGVFLARRTGKDTVKNAVTALDDSRDVARELERWRRREETMRMLRWGTELATRRDGESDGDTWKVGFAALDALGRSELLQPEDQDLIDSVLLALVADAERAYADSEADGDEPDVFLDDDEEA